MRIFIAHLFIARLVLTAWAGDSLSDSIAADHRPEFFHHLLQKGEFDQASLEYERLRFEGYHDSCALACELGNALLKAQGAERAEALFEEAVGMTPGGSQDSGKAVSGLIRAYLMRNKPALARHEIDGLDSATGAVLGKGEVSFLRSATFASSYRVDSSRAYLAAAVKSGATPVVLTARLDSLLTWYRSSNMKNPLNAFLYSSAIPGWGHWYVGDRKKAVASFALMAGLSGVLCYEGYQFYRGDTQERYVRGMDLFLVYSLVWRRYYSGIRKAAHQRAIEINRNVQLEYQERLRGIVAEE
jgi:hypothetical protein